jgi:hypothetical protein
MGYEVYIESVKIKICIEPGCKNVQTTKDYCRLHYLKNWRKIRDHAQKKAAERLNKYVEGICKKYPEKYIDVIRREIRNGKGDFAAGGEEGSGSDSYDDLLNDLGLQDDDSLDKLLSHIKIDKEY